MPLTAVPLEQRSFTGMVDALDAPVADPRKAFLLQNCYPLDPELGGPVVGRPGFRLTEDNQLGSAGNRTTQRVYQYTKLDGTEFTVGFCGGKMYTYNWTTRAWTEVTLSGVSLSTTAKVFCATFNDTLVVNPNDGTNKMWTWNSTTFVSLTNSSTVFGQPVVHYAKLFGIKWAERSTIIWSEENDPTTGYEAGGFNNAWTLGQTDQEPLHALYATNEALYYFRARSTGAIAGQVTSNFVNDGVREGVSETIGTMSPAAITSQGRHLYLLDADGQPAMLRPGIGIVGLWQEARQTVLRLPEDQLSKAVAVTDSTTRTIQFGVAQTGETNPTLRMVFRSPIGSPDQVPVFAGLWRGFTFHTLDVVKNGDIEPVVVHGATDGYFYDHGAPDGTLWDDALKSGTVAIQHVVTGTTLGYDVEVDKIFDLVNMAFQAKTNLTNVTFALITPAGETASDAFTVTGGFAVWDTAVWDTDSWIEEGIEAHHALGLNGYGRWARPKVTHSAAGEQFGFNGWRIDAYLSGKEPATL